MKVGVCTSIENAATAQEAGFDFVEENIQNFLIPEQPGDVFATKRSAAGAASLPVLAANCFLPAALKCVGPGVDEQRLDQYAEVAFQRAREAGIRRLVFGSGGSRNIPDGFSHDEARRQFLAYVRRIAPVAQARNVTILIETLNRKECNFLNTLNEGAAVVNEIDHPHVRLLADIYHMRLEAEFPDAIVKHARLIDHVHVAEKEGRLAPGSSGEDFGPYLEALGESGYRGAISFECGWKNFAQDAAASLRGFRGQMRGAGLM